MNYQIHKDGQLDSFVWSDFWTAAKYMECFHIDGFLINTTHNLLVGRTIAANGYRFAETPHISINLN